MLCFFSVILGVATAVGFSYNGVELIRLALNHLLHTCLSSLFPTIDLSNLTDYLNSFTVTALLWAANSYALGFGITFGIDGAGRLLKQVLPLLYYGNAREKIAALTALCITGVSMAPGFAIAAAANTSSSLLGKIGVISGGLTNMAPLLLTAAVGATTPFFTRPDPNAYWEILGNDI